MIRMFVGNLPQEATEEFLQEMFAEFGTVRSVKITLDVFTGKCRGFGFVEMEGHEARAAMAALDGKTVGSKQLRVRLEKPALNKRRGRGGRR